MHHIFIVTNNHNITDTPIIYNTEMLMHKEWLRHRKNKSAILNLNQVFTFFLRVKKLQVYE